MKIKNIIRVILADDHDVIRRALRRILEKEPSICVIGEASTGLDALRLVQELKPDVLLLDIELPDIKGINVAQELRAKNIQVSIVVLSACDDEYFIEETLQLGVDGYLNKNEAPEKIREAVVQVSNKYTVATSSLLILLMPKLGWVIYRAISSVNDLPFDMNLL